MKPTAPDWYTPEEVARKTRKSRRAIIRLCRSGAIPAEKLGHRWRISAVWYDEMRDRAMRKARVVIMGGE